MKTLVMSAVVLLYAAHIGSGNITAGSAAQSLQCYTCTMAISDASCQTLTNCTGSTPYCGAAIVDGVFVTLVNKFCAATCVNADQNFTFVSASEMCCTSDRCNDQTIGNVNSAFNFGSGASGLSGSALLMAALLGALLSYMFAL